MSIGLVGNYKGRRMGQYALVYVKSMLTRYAVYHLSDSRIISPKLLPRPFLSCCRIDYI